ncbi:MAG TPA: sugar transferase [Solirubrobacteraceae bacterium]|nr:sugar transferase [Solirubrobacteraceae bacterium]
MATTEGIEQDQIVERTTRRFGRRARPLPRSPRAGGPITEGASAAATSLREGLYRRTLAAADALVAVVLVLAVLPAITGDVLPAVTVFMVGFVVLLHKAVGLYERDELVLKKTTLDEAPAILQIGGVHTLVLWLLLDGGTAVELDASDVIALWGAIVALLLCGRVAARWIARRMSATERCLVAGEHASIVAVAEKLATGRVKADVVAALDLEARRTESSHQLAETFRELVHDHDVHRAIIAPTGAGSAETLELIRIAKHAGVRVSVIPRMLEVVGSSVEFDHVDGLTMLGVRRFGLSRSSRAMKRAFDLIGASLILAAAAPVMLVLALAIRLDSRGPVFFRQTRVGKDGERFQMLKFRSMVVDADERKDALRHLNETRGLFKIENDPRITRVGRWLRRTSLDELPQLINVWRGEMSLVGPRPLVVDEDAQVHGLDRHRLHLTPGMTGHWQILGSARIPMDEMVGIDYLYVANWSLWTDVKILLRTIPYVFASRGM